MLESFCVAANIRGFLHRSDCPLAIRDCLPILEQCWAQDKSGTLKTDMRSLGFEDTEIKSQHRSEIRWETQKNLTADVACELHLKKEYLCAKIENWSTPTSAFFHRRHTIRGIQYTTRQTSRGDSAVFFQPMGSDNFVPGNIQEIFSVPVQCSTPEEYREQTFLVIQRHLAMKESYSADIFPNYIHFGASLWSDQLASKPDVVLATGRICHSIGRPWAAGSVVLKSLDWVS